MYSLDLRGPPGVQEEGGDGAEAVEQALQAPCDRVRCDAPAGVEGEGGEGAEGGEQELIASYEGVRCDAQRAE